MLLLVLDFSNIGISVKSAIGYQSYCIGFVPRCRYMILETVFEKKGIIRFHKIWYKILFFKMKIIKK